MKQILPVCAAAVCAFVSVSAQAETVTYRYDVLGRVVQIIVKEGPKPAQTAIEYDAAGNRKIYSVSLAAGETGGGGGNNPSGSNGGTTVPVQQSYVVVPLIGFVVIPTS